MFSGMDFSVVIDIAIIVVPTLIVMYLLFKFLIPKKPALGIGLAIGGGLLGTWLVRRRLQAAFDVEKELAAHNEMMAEFKDKQKNRAQAVLANKQVIDTLEKQRKKLSSDADKYSTELEIIDAELEERKKLNTKILSDSDAFLESSEKRSESRKVLLEKYREENGSISGDAPLEEVPNKGSAAQPHIEINGFRLIQV